MYQIKIKPIEIENIMDTLIEKPYFTTDNNVLARKVGMNLKTLRRKKKLIIANDTKTGESFISLRKNPLALPNSVVKLKGRGRTTYEFDDDFFL
jgi:hypothetical protein